MKPVPFAQYLARQQQAAGPEPSEPRRWPPRAKAADAPAEPPRKSPLLREVEKPGAERDSEFARRLEQGRSEALDEGREAARKELDQERRRLREEMDAEIAKARAQWAEEEAAHLAQAHRAAFDALEQRCAQAVANILRPFLVQQSIVRVTDALVENMEALFAARVQSMFEISGPADLLAALEKKFAAHKATIAFTPDESIDVRVRVEDTIIETQLGPWLQALGALPRSGADE
ncbi:hypothetical protein K9U39_00940 [Rhodoblastus acidophilus]|uniref:Flagellar assembly protein FliH/Type III secretion system HrpE domain-containing protein n=1 Tax=Candidatus Rhodoblastus alkanivorans TaxID=2954117 RepID=A0ABS9Z3H5_9HYPH|nr:hypothetical protein [Candidatus Rhodoblastus alkanivorans]MCI4678835.1 hypothetical protein [Candidatus Rhodoblastus alkanivorans]MCI4682224.1 hypothetical protein [Candidatus Rhodoblastus alkanivorans]MDI4639526.1 hypothetical protein [Rhodoblastus acidophilus]